MSGDVGAIITPLRDAARELRSVTSSTADELRALARARRAIDAAMCERLAEMDAAREHEAEGASSIATWARRELNQDADETRQMVQAARTFCQLPAVGAAARAGSISFRHVRSFTYALRHVGIDSTRMIEEPLLDSARHLGPREFHARVRQARAVLHPDELDRAWLDGMDKRDIRLAKTMEGWHVTGFLDIETGAKLHTLLQNLSVPRDADDRRIPSQRRMDALDDVCTSVLEHGLPSDNGVRSHLNVTVDAERLKDALRPTLSPIGESHRQPATLQGFGPIGPQLLAHLLCGAELTPFLVTTIDQNLDVLDVGRSQRLATPRQAKAVTLRQQGICAAPGCRHPVAHHHHVAWWSEGGRTDLDNLVGLCRKCHALVHAGRLQLTRGSPPRARVA